MYYLKLIYWYTQVPPLRTISQISWILISGWLLFLSYILSIIPLILATFGMGIIFVPKICFLAKFSFNPVGHAFVKNVSTLDNPRHLHWHEDPNNIFVRILNVIWFFLIGWSFFIMHIVLAIVQLVTIVGIGNAITHLKIAKATLQPFGRRVVHVSYPIRPVKKQQTADIPMQNV